MRLGIRARTELQLTCIDHLELLS